jgi:hypothetical protein
MILGSNLKSSILIDAHARDQFPMKARSFDGAQQTFTGL